MKGIGSEVNNDFHTKIHSFRPYLLLMIAGNLSSGRLRIGYTFSWN
jgi:hypothetical protein